MGTEAEDQETEDVVIEETETEEETSEVEEQDEETTEAEAESTSEPGEEEETSDDADEVIVTIGDTPSPEESEEQKAPAWVKELRKSHRETQRENRELKQKLEAMNQPEATQVKLGPKPKLEDHDYDTEKYEAELASWYDKKRQADQQAADAEAAQEAQQKAWQEKLNVYAEKKSKLKVKDFDDAEANVLGVFDQTQQGIVVQGADDPALTIYALGKNEAKLKELAAIKDPVKFSFAVAKLETQLKVKNRKAPPPEKTVTGTAPKSGSVDSELERLRDEASRTGDYSKVHQYKRQKKRQQAS
jgi:hypothetical protein